MSPVEDDIMTMTKLERFMAAIRGEDVDRLPASVWLHFASEHLSGAEAAQLHLSFMREYDWDYLKVMNDYRYPLPGVPAVGSEAHLRRFEPLSMSEPAFAQQLACLRALRAAMGPDTPMIETLFNPLQTLVRGSGAGAQRLVFEHPDAGRHALEAITRTLIAYLDAIRDIGVTGVFYSINGAVQPGKGGLTDSQFAAFVAPYDLRILEAARGMVRVAHVHGFDLLFERVLGYPVEAFSWSHFNSAPSLSDARRLTSAALIGGINEAAVARQSTLDIAEDIRASTAQAGSRKLLIGPGCTVPPDMPRRLMKAASQTVRQLKPGR
jgi:uroporphyrinogen decarboxylase